MGSIYAGTLASHPEMQAGHLFLTSTMQGDARMLYRENIDRLLSIVYWYKAQSDKFRHFEMVPINGLAILGVKLAPYHIFAIFF